MKKDEEIRSKGDEEKKKRPGLVRHHWELEVYRAAFDVAMEVFEVSKNFPIEERYSLTDQMRRSSRSVAANLSEAWRKRRYPAAFVAKLSDAEMEAAETQTWLEFAVKCRYLNPKLARDLFKSYDQVIGKIVAMITKPEQWMLKDKVRE